MDDVADVATCGGCDWDGHGYKLRCDDPAPYRAEYRWLDDDRGGDDDPRDYTLPVCVRHAAIARTHDSLKRIYTAHRRAAAAD